MTVQPEDSYSIIVEPAGLDAHPHQAAREGRASAANDVCTEVLNG